MRLCELLWRSFVRDAFAGAKMGEFSSPSRSRPNQETDPCSVCRWRRLLLIYTEEAFVFWGPVGLPNTHMLEGR